MKYFVVSDIHSFCSELKYSLRKAGFNKRNKEHTLIVCGDIFDRGDETVEVYKYLKSIPKKRCILVKGNHESLYFELLEKSYPQRYDYSNGTVRTFCNIAKRPYDLLDDNEWLEVREIVKNHPITKWLQSAQWVDYFELNKYIFVHSFIPIRDTFDEETYTTEVIPFVNWREEATKEEWENARWGSPVKIYKAGYFDYEKQLGKTLVVGHWHTWDFHTYLGNITKSKNRDIYYSDHLIALDGGVTQEWEWYESILIPHPNVLVIDDSDFNVCYDQYGSKLTNMEALTTE